MKVLIGALCLGVMTAVTVHAELATGIQAVVDSSVVTYLDVEELTQQTISILSRRYARDPVQFQKKVEEARKENLDILTDRELILHEFKTAGYQLPDSVIDDIVKSRLREKFGDRRTATKTLQANGMTYEKFREQERDRYIIAAMRAKNISQEIIISPYKIESSKQMGNGFCPLLRTQVAFCLELLDFVGGNNDLLRNILRAHRGDDVAVALLFAKFFVGHSVSLEGLSGCAAVAKLFTEAGFNDVVNDAIGQLIARGLELVQDQFTISEYVQVFFTGLFDFLLELDGIARVAPAQDTDRLLGKFLDIEVSDHGAIDHSLDAGGQLRMHGDCGHYPQAESTDKNFHAASLAEAHRHHDVKERAVDLQHARA